MPLNYILNYVYLSFFYVLVTSLILPPPCKVTLLSFRFDLILITFGIFLIKKKKDDPH